MQQTWSDLDWMECTAKVEASPHFQEQVERMYPAYRLLHGDMSARSKPEFIRECAQLIAVLISHQGKKAMEGKPWPDRTGNNGGIQIIAEGLGMFGADDVNYRIVLHGCFVNGMRMTMEPPS